MTRAIALLITLAVPLAARSADRAWTRTSIWSAQRAPKPGLARAIGAYNAGCLQGAVALPASGPGFEVMHLHRHRYFGHPELVAFVRRLARSAAEEKLPALLVGDLAQARGGPTPTDHGSHQSGLDVDIAYTRPIQMLWQPIAADEREGMQPPAVVDLATHRFTPAWTPMVADLLELAAKDRAVDRIFVNPAVKHALCQKEADAPWLGKLRPWWGHHDHFHVRLICPASSGECRPQPPVPAGNGCDEALAWWLTNDARRAAVARLRAPHHLAAARLPPRCRAVLR
jgi:penicillin-insensitive murein DD-endopeptidase